VQPGREPWLFAFLNFIGQVPMHVIILGVLLFWLSWPLGLAVLAFLIWRGRGGRWQRWMADDRRKIGSVPPSGNAAFDEYREETLRKVADEQRGFREFLERLRRSKDKQEFDRFMADRRAAPSTGPQRSLPAV
jgi:hypothetical protein